MSAGWSNLLAVAGALQGAPLPEAGWRAADVVLLGSLPLLLLASAFFSGSETALFGLNESQRMALRQSGSRTARAVQALLSDQRMLLITLLLGNASVNVLYFVITSVLMMRAVIAPAAQGALALGFLLLLVLAGEVGPKLIASAARSRVITFIAPLLLSVHRAILPLRVVLDKLVITPFSRLTAPHSAPHRLHDAELKALLEISSHEGTIDAGERQMLRDVVDLGRLRVRDIMTPRVEMIALPADATREDVLAAVQRRGLSQIPVYEGDVDTIVGILHVKRFLLDESARQITHPAVLMEPHFVPDLARLDQLLERLRAWGVPSAIVVDEYGGTDGIVAIEDIVAELVGGLLSSERDDVAPPQLIGVGRWRASGGWSARAFCEAFRITEDLSGIATLGGIVADTIGRAPVAGDVAHLDGVRMEVLEAEAGRVLWVELSLPDAGEGGGP